MINFDTQNSFKLDNNTIHKEWISSTILSEEYEVGEINYVFCSDDYLLDINKKFLDHDTLTDIITFDYTNGNVINGEIYISTERVKENAVDYGVSFDHELRRVIIHGILHLCGYGDKSSSEKSIMRDIEDKYLKIFQEKS